MQKTINKIFPPSRSEQTKLINTELPLNITESMLTYRESIPVFTNSRHGTEHSHPVTGDSRLRTGGSRLRTGNLRLRTGSLRLRIGGLRLRIGGLRHGTEHSNTSKKHHLYRNTYHNLSILHFSLSENIQKWSPETDTNGKEENGLWQTLYLNQKAN